MFLPIRAPIVSAGARGSSSYDALRALMWDRPIVFHLPLARLLGGINAAFYHPLWFGFKPARHHRRLPQWDAACCDRPALPRGDPSGGGTPSLTRFRGAD